jgi:hypothetical protein
MTYTVRVGGNRTYTFDTPAQAEKFMQERRHSVVSYYENQGKFKVVVKMNPMDVVQATRRAGLNHMQDIGLGAYKGDSETSYGFRAKTLKQTEPIRAELGQESLYVEGQGKARIIGDKWKDMTGYKMTVRIFRRSTISGQEFMKLLTNSEYALFEGGTLFDTPDGYLVESAVFPTTTGAIQAKMERVESVFKRLGIRVEVRIKKVK